MPASRPIRLLKIVAATLVGLLLFYVVVGNVVLRTRLLREGTNVNPTTLMLEYESAYTWFPGYAKVKGLWLRFDDGTVSFQLKLDEANVRIALLDLLRKKFHAKRVRVTGISWQMLHKVQKLEGNEKRIAAFPKIEGFNASMLIPKKPDGPAPRGRGDNWSVLLEDVEGELVELWMLEYRYEGKGHVVGSFEMVPNVSVWVGPATLKLEDGTLTSGERVISTNFSLEGGCTIKPFDIVEAKGAEPLRSVSADAKISAQLKDLSAIEMYIDDFDVKGSGMLNTNLHTKDGLLTEDSTIDLQLDTVALRMGELKYDGSTRATARLVKDEKGTPLPVLHADVEGTVKVPLEKTAALLAALSGTAIDASLASANLADGLPLQMMRAKVGEARAKDARPLVDIAASKVPFIARAALGDGPLKVKGQAEMTPALTVIRLTEASLGSVTLRGAARQSGEAWNGAAAGKVSALPVGIRVKGSAIEAQPLIGEGWLEKELGAAGVP